MIVLVADTSEWVQVILLVLPFFAFFVFLYWCIVVALFIGGRKGILGSKK